MNERRRFFRTNQGYDDRLRPMKLLISMVGWLGFSFFVSCGGNADSNPSGPAGSCKTSGTATGSLASECTECGRTHCNAELTQKSGSGWASQYFGGDGACVALNACSCSCYASSADADKFIACVSVCATKIDASCESAMTAAEKCLNDNCRTECR